MNDSNLCPVCGARNACSLANPLTVDQPCWCYSVVIAPQVLEALPSSARDLACLCPRCAQTTKQPASTAG